MQGSETNIDLHHLGEDLEHSKDHRWSVRNKNSLSLNSLCAEKAILLLAKTLPRQITVSGFIAWGVSINCIFGVMGCTMFKN